MNRFRSDPLPAPNNTHDRGAKLGHFYMSKIQIFPDEMPHHEIIISQSPPKELCFGGEARNDPNGLLVGPPKPPNQKTATIGAMIEWASQANGKFKSGAKYQLINAILMDIENLTAIKSLPWPSRKWALPAWRELQRIGITDGLELLPPPQSIGFPISRIKQLCVAISLHFNKLNGQAKLTEFTP